MAFPSSPSDGDLYKGYVYDSGLWRVDRGEGALHLFDYSSSDTTYFTQWVITSESDRETFDFSSILPDEAKAVYISAFLHGFRASGSATYANVRVHFAANNTFNPAHTQNTLKIDAIGHVNAGFFIGGNVAGSVKLDANKRFYGCSEDYSQLSSSTCYLSILGYYI